ncbi:chemokine (C-X-C motif) ligand 20 [Puntigrus tetrazona]|uniref:chemokine (C-X-C motif) ligand 20 n=1 Tax=Puntigrus tetrazona TaxID=1606681 RepID=UPI001C8987C1|nr:chemokine (C-X-C motif) ligand 20 [Puntigrus tetrazona]
MNQVVLTLLSAVVFGATLTHSAGQAGGLSQRCFCRGELQKAVKPRWIYRVEMFPPSPSCSKTEIVLTLIRKGKGKLNRKPKVCLDPNKRQGQRLLKGKGKQNKK